MPNPNQVCGTWAVTVWGMVSTPYIVIVDAPHYSGALDAACRVMNICRDLLREGEMRAEFLC